MSGALYMFYKLVKQHWPGASGIIVAQIFVNSATEVEYLHRDDNEIPVVSMRGLAAVAGQAAQHLPNSCSRTQVIAVTVADATGLPHRTSRETPQL